MVKYSCLILALLFLVSCAPQTKKQCVVVEKTVVVKKEMDLTNPKKPKVKNSYRVYGRDYNIMKSSKDYQAKGLASWYGKQFHHRYTSSGERFNMYKLTAAHKTLPLSTKLLVTNLNNGRKVVVKVNDRGPFVGNRLIDLSYGAARKLGMVARGIAQVKIQALPNNIKATA